MSAAQHSCHYGILGDMLHSVAASYPDKTALIFGERRSSYRDLDRASNRIAHALIALGARPAGTVAILGKNSDTYLETLFGVAKSGAIAVLLNWRLALPELLTVIEDAGAGILLYDAEFANLVEALEPKLSFNSICMPFAALCRCDAAIDRRFNDFPDDLPAIAIAPTDPVILMYTSGTTGAPKGVPATHFALLWGVENVVSMGPRCASIDRDVNLLTTPLFHLAAIGWSLGSLYTGAALVYPGANRCPGHRRGNR